MVDVRSRLVFGTKIVHHQEVQYQEAIYMGILIFVLGLEILLELGIASDADLG